MRPIGGAVVNDGFPVTNNTEDGPLVSLATTRELLEEVCNRLDHQEACEVAGLAFRLPEDVLRHRRVEPWWSPDA